MSEEIAEFRRRLADGEVLLGPGIYMSDPQSSEALADSSDFLWYDLEHQAMSLETLRNHIMVARLKKRAAIVRIRGCEDQTLQTILDMGAHGIVAPQIRSVDEVNRLVAACRYQPQGERGWWPMIPTNYCRDDPGNYRDRANESLFVAVMIESVEAVEAIDEIVAVDGLDSVVLGLSDLSSSLGMLLRWFDPKVMACVEKVITAARKAGKPVGMGRDTNAAKIAELAAMGVQWFQAGADCLYLVEFMDGLKERVRAQLDGPDQPGSAG